MDVGVISQLVSSLGFPIAACCIMAWYVYDNNKQHRSEIEKLNQEHKEESEKFAQAINNNTLVMQKLYDKLVG